MIITTSLMTFGAGFATSAITKAEGPGKALDDIMTLVGFDKLHEVAEKKRAKRDNNIQMYKESIAQKVASIPEENLKEPPLSVVGPAIEASKYYIEEEILREMFANVISASMNTEVNPLVHPSFVDIIKQLSPLDASILKNLKNNEMSVNSLFPIMKMIVKSDTGGVKTIFPIVALFEGDDSFLKNPPSINNLERLGLINTSFNSSLIDNEYDFIRNHNQVKHVLENQPIMEFSKGSLKLTNFGQNFINICVE